MGQQKWQFGKVSGKYGALHYDILLDDGRTWRRHVDQIIKIGDNIREKPNEHSDGANVPFGHSFNTSNSAVRADMRDNAQQAAALQSTATANPNPNSEENHSSPHAEPQASASPIASSIVTEHSIATNKPKRNINPPQRLNYSK